MTVDETIAIEILAARHGSLIAQALWNRWDEAQRAEALEAVAVIRPILESAVVGFAEWTAGLERPTTEED